MDNDSFWWHCFWVPTSQISVGLSLTTREFRSLHCQWLLLKNPHSAKGCTCGLLQRYDRSPSEMAKIKLNTFCLAHRLPPLDSQSSTCLCHIVDLVYS